MTILLNHFLKIYSKKADTSLFSNDELVYIVKQLKHKDPDTIIELKDSQSSADGLQIPSLDNFIIERIKSAGFELQKIWGEDHSFAVCLTHDVDRVESYSPEVFIRNIRKNIRFNKSTVGKWKLRFNLMKTFIKSKIVKKESDPLWHYEKWGELERKFNVYSTYFMFVRPEEKDVLKHDCDYTLTDKMRYNGTMMSVSEYVYQLHQTGHEIGLHGSFLSAHKSELFKHQKESLEAIIQKPIISTRQHYLNYSDEQSCEIHSSNGIQLDSSFGSNYYAGFFNGTSFPIPFETSQGILWELPLIIMDSSLFHQVTAIEKAKEICITLIDQVEQCGGILTVNFHPDYLNIDNYWNLYEFILEETSRRKAYFSTCSGILKKIKECVE